MSGNGSFGCAGGCVGLGFRLGRVLCWEMGAGVHTGSIEGEENLAFCSLIPAGLEAWSAKKGLTVALWISQVLLT